MAVAEISISPAMRMGGGCNSGRAVLVACACDRSPERHSEEAKKLRLSYLGKVVSQSHAFVVCSKGGVPFNERYELMIRRRITKHRKVGKVT